MKIKAFEAGLADVIVVGAGHAGCEAALAAARMGKNTIVMTISLESIADMPCNPNIGGTGKGHLVREIDALGGEMAKVIDRSYIQSRMLNTSKGPAIHSLRVQADKRLYHDEMKKSLEKQENLRIIEGEVKSLLVENKKVKGVIMTSGAIYRSEAVILATGTFLNGLIMKGELMYSSGPHGLSPAKELSSSLEENGIELRRFKTGTPARVHRRSIDYSELEPQVGDKEIIPFSFENAGEDFQKDQVKCYLTHTNKETNKIIFDNLSRSPMYAGEIHGVGPRYCPSIEDKAVRFKDKDSHQVFLEPEGLNTDEIYVQGVSTTLPEEVQLDLYRTIKGLENVEIMRFGYGIEYDCIDPTILKTSLECKLVENLFFAGQINSSSGYEEAASQGIMAGINAVLKLEGKEALVLDRSEAYIGVLIDDLVTKGTNEPYRMMTSRAEYRLHLRQDNADLRLTEKGYKIGLASKKRYEQMLAKKDFVSRELARLKSIIINPSKENNEILDEVGSVAMKKSLSLYELLKRPELNYLNLLVFDKNRPDMSKQMRIFIETEIKYEGYIAKQNQQIEKFKKLENKRLDIENYSKVKGLKKEAMDKLNRIRPDSIGQASRISGVSPSDINVLLVYLEIERREKDQGK